MKVVIALFCLIFYGIEHPMKLTFLLIQNNRRYFNHCCINHCCVNHKYISSFYTTRLVITYLLLNSSSRVPSAFRRVKPYLIFAVSERLHKSTVPGTAIKLFQKNYQYAGHFQQGKYLNMFFYKPATYCWCILEIRCTEITLSLLYLDHPSS